MTKKKRSRKRPKKKPDLAERVAVSKNDLLKQELEKIRNANTNQILEAEEVVEEAAQTDHPLHKFFEWDQGVAAHLYRVHQARNLIRTVTIETVVHERTIVSVAYTRDPARDKGYLSVGDPQATDVSDEIVRQELKGAWFRVHRLKQLAAAFDLEMEVDLIENALRTFEEVFEQKAAS